ncbi:NAD-dependent epimerase/dehydratase family protein [Listeria costaricensis]|uniref:NAD-dependent epimerase/dehydratase family protein n=1 Tax=Listeria costaricensis TaxID=2026604 RepID=UPI000C068223|nr:NAD-dependent epimerase/dehydratase family protein [Listeria costaricensis]
MKVLIFGGTRFFGKRLVELLAAAGHEVTVATRGKTVARFPENVRHVRMNRKHRDEIFSLAQEPFDLVYDNICFSPQEALYAVQAFKKQSVRYIFTSSLSVYGLKGRALQEEDFDASHYEIVTGDEEDFDYGEGKRLAEAVFFQKADFPVVAVRFPIVLGTDDYTKRLVFHLQHIARGEEIGISQPESRIGFIRSDEAARFLFWVGTESDWTGPINAASEGTYTLAELMEKLELMVGKKALIEAVTEEEDESPFSAERDFYLDQTKAKQAGFSFLDLHTWLPELAEQLINNENIGKKE